VSVFYKCHFEVTKTLKKTTPVEILLLLVTFGFLVGFNWFTNTVQKNYDAVNVNWSEYIAKESQILENLFQLKSHLGYGGIIHSFKNYVLRDDQKYLSNFLESSDKLSLDINKLRPYLTSNEELKALATIHLVVNKYKEKTKIVTQLHLEKSTSQEIDQQVFIDDSQAFLALQLLTDKRLERTEAAKGKAAIQMRIAHEFLEQEKFVQIPLVLLVLTIILMIRRLNFTKEKALDAKKWVDILLETAPDAILSMNREGKIIKSNKMAEDLLGYSKIEFKNLIIEDLLLEKDRSLHSKSRENYFQSPKNRPMNSGERLKALTKNGKEFSAEINLSYTLLQGKEITIAAIRDVTQQERSKLELIQAKSETEKALKQLQQATDTLIESEKQAAIAQLVAGVAHEINTPIGICLSASTHLSDKTLESSKSYNEGELSEEELEKYFIESTEATRLINSNLERAANQIQSFKQVAVDQSSGEWRKFNLKTYIDEILLSIRSIQKKSKVTLENRVPEDLELETYPSLIFQCISNLVINGISHAFEQNQVGKIELYAEKIITSRLVKVTIKDNGKGIPLEIQKKIFDPFFTTKRDQGGSGLGMGIVKKIVTYNLGGDITFSSEEGKGTTFIIQLPWKLKT